MKIGALIPARISSKRLPKKNIKLLHGKPLIYWTIEKLLEADTFAKVTVCTESPEIVDVVRDAYGEKDVDILMRPEELGGDCASLDRTSHYYLDQNPDIDYFGLFMSTYPFRTVESLRDIDYEIRSRKPIRAISLTSQRYWNTDYYYPKGDGVKRLYQPYPINVAATISSYVYWHRNFTGSTWVQSGLMNAERLLIHTVTRKEAIDIDTAADFQFAEQIAAGGQVCLRKPVEYSVDGWGIILPEGVNLDHFLDYVGREKLQDKSLPILFLGEAAMPQQFLWNTELSSREYLTSLEAADYLEGHECCKTGRSQDLPRVVASTKHYRMLRLGERDTSRFGRLPKFVEPDHGGEFFGSHWGCFDVARGNASYPHSDILPMDRVVLMSDLVKQDFYKDPVMVKSD